MPDYKYHCEACGHEFAEFVKLIRKKHPKKCPACGRMKLESVIGLTIGSRKKETVGSQAERNMKGLSKEKLDQIMGQGKQGVTQETRQRIEQLGGQILEKQKPSSETGGIPWWRDGSVGDMPRSDKPLPLEKMEGELKGMGIKLDKAKKAILGE